MYNLYDYIKSIVEKRPIELDSNYSQYALNMYFSKFKNCIICIDYISMLKLDNNMHYQYLQNMVPYGWQKKVEYKEKNNKAQNDIENVMKYYNINESRAKEYLVIMSEDEIRYLREVYNV